MLASVVVFIWRCPFCGKELAESKIFRTTAHVPDLVLQVSAQRMVASIVEIP